MKTGAAVDGRVAVTEATVLTILEEEARESVREATKLLRAAADAEAPVGPTGLLAKSHKQSVTRTPYGIQGRLKRRPEAWYGRIVERGRKPGRSKRSGRRVSAAKANPFIDRAAAQTAAQAEALMEEGAVRAARRIEARVNG